MPSPALLLGATANVAVGPPQLQPRTLPGFCGTTLQLAACSPQELGILLFPCPILKPRALSWGCPHSPDTSRSIHLQLDLGFKGCHYPGGELPTNPAVFTVPWQCFTIEKLGRRPLIITGFCTMGICLAGITISLLLQVGSGHHPLEH